MLQLWDTGYLYYLNYYCIDFTLAACKGFITRNKFLLLPQVLALLYHLLNYLPTCIG